MISYILLVTNIGLAGSSVRSPLNESSSGNQGEGDLAETRQMIRAGEISDNYCGILEGVFKTDTTSDGW